MVDNDTEEQEKKQQALYDMFKLGKKERKKSYDALIYHSSGAPYFLQFYLFASP